MDKRGGGEGGVIKTICKKFLSHTSGTFRRRNLLWFRKSLVSKNVRAKQGACHDVPLKMFCLTVPKRFAGEPFSVSLIWCIEIFGLRALCHDFLPKFYLSQGIEINHRGTVLCFTKFLVSKFFWTGWEHHVL